MLTLLDERPMHGYELITELDSRSGGRWRPSAGAIYPALNRMEQHGLITSDEVDGKKRFRLTTEGREVLAEQRSNEGDDAPAPWDDTARGGRGELRRHMSELVGQARQIGRFGTTAQIERAAVVLEGAKRQLYAILAEPPIDDEQDTSAEEPAPVAEPGDEDTGGAS